MATWKGLIFDPASALEDPLSGPDVIRNVAVSRDSRQIYMTRGADEGDIWMAQIK
jgi:hypothetical protein